MEVVDVIEKVSKWDKARQIEFCDRISLQITIAIRDIWSDEEISTDEKIEAIKWINEFHHRVNNVRFDIKRNTDSASAIRALCAHAQEYAQENPRTRGGIRHSISDAYAIIQERIDKVINFQKVESSIYSLIESDSFRKRMPMYIDERKLSLLKAFMNGYFYAMDANAIIVQESDPSFELFHDWVSQYFGWRESTAGWKNIILTQCGKDEEKAVDLFLELYDAFKKKQ